jgi:hypothetical protein
MNPLPITGSNPDAWSLAATTQSVWTPLERLAEAFPQIELGAAMYFGSVDTPAGTAYGFKNADTRRTFYVLPELIARYRSVGPDGELVPFASVTDAVEWWTS